jgi:hypothetical protein
LVLVIPVDRLHADQIDDPGEVFLGADRQLDRHGVAAEPVLDLLDDAQEIRAHAVHLVDEREARHTVLVGLAPDRLRLGLDTADRAEHGAGAVEHAQGTLDLDREVDVPGVSMMLIRCSGNCWSMPFQKQVVAADVMVMPRSCSCSIQSMVAAPSCTSPILCDRPV